MKYEGFALEFVNLIRGFKLEKIKKVINGDAQSKNPDKKMGLVGFVADILQVDKKNLPDTLKNIILNIDVDAVCENLNRIVVDEVSFFDSVDCEDTENWIKNLSELKQNWKKEQGKEQYKAQSLKNKIIKETIKSLERIDESYDKQKVKYCASLAIDQIYLSLDLDVLLTKLKQELNEQQSEAVDSKKQLWVSELKEISDKYGYANWLDRESKNALNVSFSTHVAKLTHSSISGSASSIYFDEQDESPVYLSTAALKDKPIDVSQTSSIYTPIGKLLKLQIDGQYLADKFSKSDVADLAVFAKDEEQVRLWAGGFIKSFQNRKPSSHSLAKQIYFPVHDKYNLISPLVSSSIDQAIFDRINYVKFSEVFVEIRKQKRENKFHKKIAVSYPNIAVIKVTASKHGNASPLNSARGGKRYLLSSMPPNWKSSITPPLKQSSIFYGEFDKRAWKLTRSLQEYLLALQDKKSNKRIRDQVKSIVNEIIDTLFNYVIEIQNLADQGGWSEHAEKLKEAHQLWLDPYRQDDNFQQTRKRGDWQEIVCYDFGSWLNHKLEHNKMKFSKIEAKSWAKVLLKRLRELERDLEVA